MIVALRMTVVRTANGRYVLGNGSAFGRLRAPAPGETFGVLSAAVSAGRGAGAGTGCCAAQPTALAPRRSGMNARMVVAGLRWLEEGTTAAEATGQGDPSSARWRRDAPGRRKRASPGAGYLSLPLLLPDEGNDLVGHVGTHRIDPERDEERDCCGADPTVQATTRPPAPCTRFTSAASIISQRCQSRAPAARSARSGSTR